MQQGPGFRHLVPPARMAAVALDGQVVTLPDGAMLAAALLAHGVAAFGASVSGGEPRGPLCLMGTCLQCTLLVDGVPMRACRVVVRGGMTVERRLDPVPASPREIAHG